MGNSDYSIKDIPGYEGLYAVTDDGRVFSYRYSRFLKPYINRSKRWGVHGRPLVKLSSASGYKVWFVSKLVYMTFIGELPKGYDIDHINGIKGDNRKSNLRALSRSDNMLSFFESQNLTCSVK